MTEKTTIVKLQNIDTIMSELMSYLMLPILLGSWIFQEGKVRRLIAAVRSIFSMAATHTKY